MTCPERMQREEGPLRKAGATTARHKADLRCILRESVSCGSILQKHSGPTKRGGEIFVPVRFHFLPVMEMRAFSIILKRGALLKSGGKTAALHSKVVP